KDFTVIPGATERTYVVPAVSQSDGGVYVVVVVNGCGFAWSDPASVTIQTTILTHPAGQTVCENDPVFFTVGATGAALTYQWRKDGVNISGATQNFFVINAAALSDAGIYDVVVTSAQCVQTSDPAPLVVQQCP
ncbi:MAG: phage tail protein, partial [Planctomycetes bacterium]|nr:phage tail protein [Planctomycetota bacterium]